MLGYPTFLSIVLGYDDHMLKTDFPVRIAPLRNVVPFSKHPPGSVAYEEKGERSWSRLRHGPSLVLLIPSPEAKKSFGPIAC